MKSENSCNISVHWQSEMPNPESINLNVDSHDLTLMVRLKGVAYEMWGLC